MGWPYGRELGRIADALEALVRIQRAILTGKYLEEVEEEMADEEFDSSEVLYHDDEAVAREEEFEEKKRVLKAHGKTRTTE